MIDRHEHLDEGTIHAWLDDALPPDESARIEAQASACTECSALVAEARGLIAASSRILSSLDNVPAGVIPGSTENVDQLAALRARHGTRKRSWWNDRRIVAAASIVFVAGLSTMVWQSAPETAKSPLADRIAAEATKPLVDSATPSVIAPAAGSDAANRAREAASRVPETDLQAKAPAAPPAPAPVAPVLADSATERKVAGASSLARGTTANEAKATDASQSVTRQAEARRELSQADALSPVQQQSLRQQGTIGQQQGVQQFRPDTMRMNAPPPSFGSRARTAPAVMGAAASAEVASGACFRLRPLAENERITPDTVQLLNEVVPLERNLWYRTRTFGTVRDSTLVWRSIDSITVELRNRMGSGAVGIVFVTTGAYQTLLNQSTNQRVAISERIACP